MLGRKHRFQPASRGARPRRPRILDAHRPVPDLPRGVLDDLKLGAAIGCHDRILERVSLAEVHLRTHPRKAW